MKIEVRCPADAGRVRCPILGAHHYLDPDLADKTDVGRNAPGHNPPLVCRQAYTTLTFKEEKKRKNSNSEELTSDFPVFKQWQPIREGTWEHGDWMANVRSPDEASTRDSSHPAEVHEPPAKLWHAETPS